MQIKSWQIVAIGITIEVLVLLKDPPYCSVDMYCLGSLLAAIMVILAGSAIVILLSFKKTSSITALLLIIFSIVFLFKFKSNLISLFNFLFNRYSIFFDSILIGGVYHFRKNIIDSLKQFFR